MNMEGEHSHSNPISSNIDIAVGVGGNEYNRHDLGNIPPPNNNTSYIPEAYKDSFQHAMNSPKQLFSMAYEHLKWFMGLRWYIILFVIVIGSFTFIQIESAIETRRKKRESTKNDKDGKEGMEEINKVDHMKGILRKSNDEYKLEYAKKQVSFYTEETRYNLLSIFTGMRDLTYNAFSNTLSNLFNVAYTFYRLWILPYIYVAFRTIGMR
jgi:hypothetical protein